MARHKITNEALGKAIGIHPNSVSRIRTRNTMPEYNGTTLNTLCYALSTLSQTTITPHDLIEYTPDEQTDNG